MFKTQRKIAIVWICFCVAVSVLNLLIFIFDQQGKSLIDYLLPNVGVMGGLALVGMVLVFFDNRLTRVTLILLFLLPSGPALLSANISFFGMWMFIIALTLTIKLQPFQKFQTASIVLVGLYFLPWLIASVNRESDGGGSLLRAANYFLFLVVGFLSLYFLFEEEIRDLLASNKHKDSALAEKDTELAKQAAEIARLEPLSVLGERVAHVAHSFKNNLHQISTAIFLMEQLHDEKRAVAKLEEFSRNVVERIENILMISRSGVDLTPEVFDVARLLMGLNHVYLQEKSFQDRAVTELKIAGPELVTAVRWDFILMVENILKNALEALIERGVRGTIRIVLEEHRLTISNDGGGIKTCIRCPDTCLDCPLYGKPGRTTKKGGTGHGMSHVFATCRKNSWGLRIRAHEEWTIIEILLRSHEAIPV